jgi:hypothetical protein
MRFSWKKVRPVVVVVGRVAGALAVAYAFLVVLMTASLQDQIAKQLADLDEASEYNAAFALWRESRQLGVEIDSLKQQQIAMQDARDRAAERGDSALEDYLKLEAGLLALISQLEEQYGCRIGLVQPNPKGLAAAQAQIRRCVATNDLTPAQAEVDAVLRDWSKMTDANRDWIRQSRASDRFDQAVRSTAQQIVDKRVAQDERASVNEKFDMMTALRQRWIVGGGQLTEMPRAIIQILLAFVSGMFGGLLLTMVFVVYPDISFRLTTRNPAYGPRILLGGLISVCVFVVVGGGTAVLGTESALADGGTNFLAFCAIGILAGMFSDRVASWLSERANDFFNARQARDVNGQQPVPLPQQPPQHGGAAPVPAS